MNGSWRIARIMGIDIRVDASWFIIFFLVTVSFVTEFGVAASPRGFRGGSLNLLNSPTPLALGILASLLLFASVLAHELSHSWMAIRRGIPVISITLFIFGGVARIADEPDRPATEFLIAIMGPLMSAALAGLFGGLWIWLRVVNSSGIFAFSSAPAILLFGILAQVNLSLAVFNLAPGFPLDGGRVLRAILWGWWHDLQRATLWAARAGQTIAVIFVAIGAWLAIHDRNLFGAVWLGLIAIFLWNAARESYRQILVRDSLKQVRVEQLMLRDVKLIPPDISVTEFVGQYLVHYRDPAFAVSDGVSLRGLISSHNVREFPRAEWQSRRVSDAMTPTSQLPQLSPSDSGAVALAQLMRSHEPELPVMEGSTLVGVLGETEISKFLRLNL